MGQNIYNIFDSITPDNIKNLPVIQDAMAIFTETLEMLSKESIDVKNIYENPEIKDVLYKTYLDDIYNAFQAVRNNTKLKERIDSINKTYSSESFTFDYLPFADVNNLFSFVNEENFFTIKSYKENKGTLASIDYAYELIKSFTDTSLSDAKLSITQISPFNLDVAGPLPKEFYDYLVHPLAHPLGFTYVYSQLIELVLQDFFPQEVFEYTASKLDVVCFKDNNTIITSFLDRNIKDIKNIFENNIRKKIIYFGGDYDGEYLEQTTSALGQTYVTLRTDHAVIQEFSGQCQIDITYTAQFVNTISEDANYIDEKLIAEYSGMFGINPTIGYFAIGEDTAIIYGQVEEESWETITSEYTIYNELNNWQDYSLVPENQIAYIGQDNLLIGQDDFIILLYPAISDISANADNYSSINTFNMFSDGLTIYSEDHQFIEDDIPETVENLSHIDNSEIIDYYNRNYYDYKVNNFDIDSNITIGYIEHNIEENIFSEMTIVNELNTWEDYSSTGDILSVIGQENADIGDKYIYAYKVVKEINADNYSSSSTFNINSDDQGFSFGMYRDDVLLTNNNVF